MTFTCTVNADLFRRAMACQSTEQTRYNLCGVHVEPCAEGGVLMVSTDGRCLIAVRDPDGQCEGAAIVALASDTAKALKTSRRDPPRSLRVVDGTATVLCATGDIHIQAAPALVDGTFPDWRSVVPQLDTSAPALPSAFNGKLIERLAAALSSKDATPAVILYGQQGDAHLAFGTDDVEAFGVIMPLRMPISPRRLDWALSRSPAPAIAAE